eukprot:SAG11_NODE_8326_length_1028_cov_2.043057_2_plen_174_part_00
MSCAATPAPAPTQVPSEAAAPAPAPAPDEQSEEDDSEEDEYAVSPISLENGPAPPTNYKLILKALEHNRLDILKNEGIIYVDMGYQPPDTRILRQFIFREWDEQGELRETHMERDQAIEYFERKLQTPMTAHTKAFIDKFIEAGTQQLFIDAMPEWFEDFQADTEKQNSSIFQ